MKEVNMSEPGYLVDDRAKSYATATDFFDTFTEQLDSLYLLSLLLTADKTKAEECFACAMQDCVDGIGVFKGWELSSARQAVLKHAIEMIKPMPEHPESLPSLSFEVADTSAENGSFAAIISLAAFERFVFVMLILERRSDLECAILLRSSREDITIARTLAFKRLATGAPGHPYPPVGLRGT
jgi:hypothetical protein